MTFTGVLIKMSSWIKFKILWKSSIILKLREFRRTKMVYTELFHQKSCYFLEYACYLTKPTKQTILMKKKSRIKEKQSVTDIVNYKQE